MKKAKFGKEKTFGFLPGIWTQHLKTQQPSCHHKDESHMLTLVKQEDRRNLLSWWHVWIATLSLDHLPLGFLLCENPSSPQKTPLYVKETRLSDTHKCNSGTYNLQNYKRHFYLLTVLYFLCSFGLSFYFWNIGRTAIQLDNTFIGVVSIKLGTNWSRVESPPLLWGERPVSLWSERLWFFQKVWTSR